MTVLLHLPQASGPPLPPLALDLLPVTTSPSPPLTTTKQCSLEGDNHMSESMTATSWILSQWYAQRNCDNSIMHSKCYQMKVILHCETECLQVQFTEPQLYVYVYRIRYTCSCQ